MRFSTLLAALPVAMAAPATNPVKIPGSQPDVTPPGGVTIKKVAYAGSGCQAGTVAPSLSDDKSTLTLLYDSFVAQTGDGRPASDGRKNCQLNINLDYPQGWQYSVVKVDYRGYAYLNKGDKGTCKATYYFSGVTNQVSSTLALNGPYDDNYIKTDEFGIETTVWSPCGEQGILNVNSEVRISPLDSKKNALLTVDSQDLKFTQIHHLQWQECTKP